MKKGCDLQGVLEPAEQPYVDIRVCSYRDGWKLLSIIIKRPVILVPPFFLI